MSNVQCPKFFQHYFGLWTLDIGLQAEKGAELSLHFHSLIESVSRVWNETDGEVWNRKVSTQS